ncbi:MAG: hypothetical protein CL933_03740 [Deltaproteobacteria bacterium]|nr:hypothetical protein [Deltaproteobacteria bacterium]
MPYTIFEEGHAQVAVTERAFEAYNSQLDAVGSEMAFIKDTRSVERNDYIDARADGSSRPRTRRPNSTR